jgi:hypothetical protein
MYGIQIVSENTRKMEKMKMKTIRNLFLVLALTASFAYADGHTGSGNRCDTCPPPCTENCVDGFTNEGALVISGEPTEVQSEEQTIFEYWTETLLELIA